MARTGTSRRPGRRTGATTVELALALPILTMLLAATAEFGLILQASRQLRGAAREGARSASTGMAPQAVSDRVVATAWGIDQEAMATVLEWRQPPEEQWATLVTDAEENTATQGSQIRATVTYSHRLLIPGVFGSIVGAEGSSMAMTTSVTMRRE